MGKGQRDKRTDPVGAGVALVNRKNKPIRRWTVVLWQANCVNRIQDIKTKEERKED